MAFKMTLSFKDYLVEAKFDGANMDRVMNAFQKRLPRLLGGPIYRYGGKDGTDGAGVLYFFKNRAFRVRVKGSNILGIDVWDKYALNKGPSYFIDIRSFSAETILASMTKLANLIKNPEAGKHKLSESQLDEMAKRVSDQEFFNLAKDDFSASELKRMKWSDIQQVAQSNDVLIPGYIKSQKVGKGEWDITPKAGGSSSPSRSSSSSDDDEDDGGPQDFEDARGRLKAQMQNLMIKVNSLDPDSGAGLSAADRKKAAKMFAMVKKALDADPTEEELKDPETMYGHMAQLVEMACRGKLRSLLIYGGPGTGKTYTIMQTVQKVGLAPGKDYVKLSGKATPVSIYETLFMFRKGGLVIFDDLDSMWRNEEATNILKAALDTSPVREISWSSANTENVSRWNEERREDYNNRIDALLNNEDPDDEDDEDDDDEDDDAPRKKKKSKKPEKVKYPSTFEFKGRVIFISNLKKEEFDTAIMSRSAKIGMDMTPEQILQRMRTVLPNLGGTDVSLELKEQLLEQLLKMRESGELDQVTMREFTKGLDIVRSGAPNWRDLIQYA